MNPPQARRPRRVRDARGAGAALFAVLALVALVALAAGCGGESASDTPAAGATPTAIQVLAKATRGDLTQSVMGAAKVEKSGGKTVVVATIDAQNAASVAAGQAATVLFFSGSQSGMPQPGADGMPQGGASGMPVPQGGQSGMPVPPGSQSGMPQPDASGMPVPQGGPSGMPQPGAGGMPQGGFPGGPGQGDRGGTAGTVTGVSTNADGTAAATISVDELPESVTTKSTGFARIEVKVLASDVVLIPTAAVEGSGSSATVQVVADGKTETRTVTAGQQAGAQTEIVSGLNEGENVVYTQAFQGFPGGNGQSGMPMPQQGGQTSGDQSSGSFQ